MLTTSFACRIPGNFTQWVLVDGSKENTVLRAALDPHMVSVIPNAVITDNFRPAPYKITPPEQSMPSEVVDSSCYRGDITLILQQGNRSFGGCYPANMCNSSSCTIHHCGRWSEISCFGTDAGKVHVAG